MTSLALGILRLISTDGAPPQAASPAISFSKYFVYDPTIKASELLTALSILVAVVTLTNTLLKGIRDRRDSEADKIRAAAAQSLSKLERWCILSLWYYEDVQPLYVETSELLVSDFNTDHARDYLWKSMTAARIKSVERILNESIEDAYVGLSSYYPAIYDLFVQTLASIESVDRQRYEDLLHVCQQNVTGTRNNIYGYKAAALGNSLREGNNEIKMQLEAEMIEKISGLKTILVHIIKSSSQEILALRKRPLPVPSELTEAPKSLFRTGHSSENRREA